MTEFILNNQEIQTGLAKGMLLLDFIRYHQHLKGTKIGCREGDCGACMVLIGNLDDSAVRYQSFTSCLTPLGNVQGKHVVTIEGINGDGLNPIQQAMCDHSATQCGFCTPGFVVSLAGFCLDGKQPAADGAIAAVDGNICRCTGYKSIERAAATVAQLLDSRKNELPVQFAARHRLVPLSFLTIPERLKRLKATNGLPEQEEPGSCFVGGGTDLYVQKHDEMKGAAIRFLYDQPERKMIIREGERCRIGGSATVTDLGESALMRECFPALDKYVRLISSTPIRNMATISGNFINASPIGDLTIFFLALDASIVLSNGHHTRELPLRSLYKGYKTLDRQADESIRSIYFNLPGKDTLFNFEKVSKRTNLDIASVNAAISITVKDQLITKAHLSAGGVGPVPVYLQKTAAWVTGRRVDEALVMEAVAAAQTEISPISDARGTAAYKRLLLSQLIKAHFITLFPELKADRLLQPAGYG